jgi:hypothetical protein
MESRDLLQQRLTAALREVGRLTVELQEVRRVTPADARELPLGRTANDSERGEPSAAASEDRRVRSLQYELAAVRREAAAAVGEAERRQAVAAEGAASQGAAAAAAESRCEAAIEAASRASRSLPEHLISLDSVLSSLGVAHNTPVTRLLSALWGVADGLCAGAGGGSKAGRRSAAPRERTAPERRPAPPQGGVDLGYAVAPPSPPSDGEGLQALRAAVADVTRDNVRLQSAAASAAARASSLEQEAGRAAGAAREYRAALKAERVAVVSLEGQLAAAGVAVAAATRWPPPPAPHAAREVQPAPKVVREAAPPTPRRAEGRAVGAPASPASAWARKPSVSSGSTVSDRPVVAPDAELLQAVQRVLGGGGGAPPHRRSEARPSQAVEAAPALPPPPAKEPSPRRPAPVAQAVQGVSSVRAMRSELAALDGQLGSLELSLGSAVVGADRARAATGRVALAPREPSPGRSLSPLSGAVARAVGSGAHPSPSATVMVHNPSPAGEASLDGRRARPSASPPPPHSRVVASAAASSRSRLLAGLSPPPEWTASPAEWPPSSRAQVVTLAPPVASPVKSEPPPAPASSRLHMRLVPRG